MPRAYVQQDCATVRVLGEQMKFNYMDKLAPPPTGTATQVRTISAWGHAAQADLVRLRIGIVGAGSVGGLVAECLARTGFEDIMLRFDQVEQHNLDRLVYATRDDVGRPNVEGLAQLFHEAPPRRNLGWIP